MDALSFRVELQSGSTWSAFPLQDLLAEPVHCWRGIRGQGPTDNIAETGTMDFELRNDEGNAAGLRGRYSPNHPNCLPGFGLGAPVRVVCQFGGGEMFDPVPFDPVLFDEGAAGTPIWTGHLHMIAPLPGVHGPRRTICLAHDYMAKLAEADVLEVSQRLNQPEDVLIEAVLDSLPIDAQPVARDLDPGVDRYAVALDDLDASTKGLTALERIVTSAQGKLFVLGDGTLRYQNRETAALQATQYAFDDGDLSIEDGIAVPSDLGNVYNRARLVGHPKEFSSVALVVATHSGALPIGLLATEVLWLTYRDPDRSEAIGVKDGIQPVPDVDYIFNDKVNGSGADVTGNMIVTAEFFTSTVKLTITNTSGTPGDGAHKQLLQVRGTAIYDLSPVTRDAFTPMPYGNRSIEIDLPYQADEAVLQERADMLVATYADLRDQVSHVRFHGNRSVDLLQQALDLEIGDVIAVSELVTLPNGVSAYIQSIEMTIQHLAAGPWLTCQFGLAPRIIVEAVATEEVLVLTEDAETVAAAPENRIGFMEIGFMEIGA